LEQVKILQILTQKIAGDIGESRSIEEIIATDIGVTKDSILKCFSILVWDISKRAQESSLNLSSVWKLMEEGNGFPIKLHAPMLSPMAGVLLALYVLSPV
jgi:hypothetical protein